MPLSLPPPPKTHLVEENKNIAPPVATQKTPEKKLTYKERFTPLVDKFARVAIEKLNTPAPPKKASPSDETCEAAYEEPRLDARFFGCGKY